MSSQQKDEEVLGDKYHSGFTFHGEKVNKVIQKAWFDNGTVTDIEPEARRLLENYSCIPPESVVSHVLEQRARAFTIAPYPCIGQMRFLRYNLKDAPFRSKVIAKLKAGGTYVDSGCCMGQDLRYMTSNEGISSSQLFGFDMTAQLMDIGYDLFLDRGTFKATFICVDVLSSATADAGAKDQLSVLDGTMDVVGAFAFLHIWPWDEQIMVVKQLVQLTRPGPGAMICGQQYANANAGHYNMPNSFGRHYRHNEDSMNSFWGQIGQETKSEWSIEAQLYSGEDRLAQNREHAWADVNDGIIWWCATRIR